MKKYLFLLAILSSHLGMSQIQDAWIFFADKENVETSINNPITILTQEAIDRKMLHDVVIDERDVPVTEAYITEIKNAQGITVWAKSKWMNCVYVQGTLADIENLLILPFVTGVEYADKDLNFPVPISHDDKFAIENQNLRIEYDYGAAANQIEMIAGDYLHQQDYTGEGMIVAVMDAGFPNFESNPGFAHVMDNGRLLGTYDFYSRTTDVTGTGSHGINTTSDIAGYLENQFVGTAPDVSLYLFRTEYGPDENPREEAWWVEALERADSLGVDVINTSLGYQAYDNPNYDHNYEDLDGLTTFAARGANAALDKGMLLITSAGNQGNGFGTVATPADAIGTMAIGAVDSNGNYVSFSSRGPTVDGRIKPDVMAQGQSSAVISQNGNVDFSSGTSFSSPILAGAITCLWQSKPEAKNFEVMQVVRESAHLFDNPTDQMGYGIPNFHDAYYALNGLGIEDAFLKINFAVYPNPVRDQLFVSFPQNIDTATVEVYNILGERVLYTEVSTQNNTVNFSDLASGIYIANVKGESTQNSFKIVKQ
jgi:serine protease AprX